MLQLRWSKVRDECNLSASDNSITPSSPIPLPVLSENEMKQHVLQVRSSEVSDEFDFLSSSDNMIAPSVPMSFTVWSENETKHLMFYI
jgi:hypothetical protein